MQREERITGPEASTRGGGAAARRLRLIACSGAALTIAAMGAGAARAATDQATTASADAGPSLGEVTVTARKRSENLQRVPVAITAQTGAQLQQQRITQPLDLPRIVPSLSIINASGSDNSAEIAMRGQQASDILLGFSQPVGVYEDTINIPHPYGANNAFFDLDRVEVLRGPQGTLYGRNTTAGAINIITRSADYSGLHGFLEGEGGNYDEWRLGGAVNAPLIQDVLAIRVAYQHWSQQGFGRSLVTGEHFGNDHNDNIVRASIRFDPTSNFDANLKIEYTNAHHTAPMLSAYAFSTDPSVNPTANTILENQALWKNYALYSGLLGEAFNPATPPLTAGADIAQVLAAGQATLANCIGNPLTNCSSVRQFDNLETVHGVIDLKWEIAPNLSLRSLTGYHWFTDTEAFDLGTFQSTLLNVGYGIGGLQPPVGPPVSYTLAPQEESGQWTQEFDLQGKSFGDHLNWLVGAFGSWDKGTQISSGLAFGQFLGFLDGGSESPFGNQSVITSKSWALFTQDDIHFTRQIGLTVGLRYTSETLGDRNGPWTYSTATGAYTCNGVLADLTPINYAPPVANDPASCANSVYSTGPNNEFAGATFSGLSYLASLNFQITDAVLLYLKTARGFRGGAFGPAIQRPAKPENDEDYEIGLKGDFADHRLRVDLAAYWTDYNNKQVSAYACTTPVPPGGTCQHTTTLLENAASARIRGVEWDLQAVPLDHVVLFSTGSWTQAVYSKFLNASGAYGEIIADASHEPIGVTPTLQFDVGGRYEVPAGPGKLGFQMDYAYKSGIPLTQLNRDTLPVAIQESVRQPVGLVNGRIDWSDADSGVTLSLWCTNIANKLWHNETLLFPSAYIGGVGQETVNPPRTYGFTVRKTFGGG